MLKQGRIITLTLCLRICICIGIPGLGGPTSAQTARPKIGLVLSGGGARGLAHIGTLKMLDSLQIPVDFIVGTSMGGIIGGLYACGYSGNEIEKIALELNWPELFSDKSVREKIPYLEKKDDGKFQLELGLDGITPVIPGGMIRGQNIILKFSDLTSAVESITDFDSLPVPYRCVTVDLITGKEVILHRGSLARAMRATMAIPTVFTPVEWGDSLLIDGGLLNNLPADVAKIMGADIIIGVNVGTSLRQKKDLQTIMGVVGQTMVITDYSRQLLNGELCNVLIKPELGNYSISDLENEKVRNIIRLGEQAAQNHKQDLLDLKNACFGADSGKGRPDSVSGFKPAHADKMVPEKKDPIIYGIVISGNRNLPFGFINNLLGLKAGDIFNKQVLHDRIQYLYGLGYFEEISYTLDPVKQNYIRLNINVKEVTLRKLRLGFRYDDAYKLVGILSSRANNIPFAGLRGEFTIQFAGLLKVDWIYYYPSRSLNMPVFPYVRVGYKDIPADIYSLESAKRIAQYDDISRIAAAGFAFNLGRSGLLKFEYIYENVNIYPSIEGLNPAYFPSWNDHLRMIRSELALDRLDEPIYPKRGFKIDAEFYAGLKDQGWEWNFYQLQVSTDFYQSFGRRRRHTLRFNYYYTDSRQDLPMFKYPFKGGSNSFVGLEINQLQCNNFSYVRLDYIYQYRKDILPKLILNAGSYRIENYMNIKKIDQYLYGIGLGVKFLSIIGPFELIFSQGSKSVEQWDKFVTRIYFTAGYNF
jgi:NTE family protein